MKKITKTLLIASYSICIFVSCSAKYENQPLKVIFETDMGNDIDDALALDMLYKYADQNQVELLAVSTNKNNEYSAKYLDVINSFYGYPDVPIGEVKDGANSEGDKKSYVQTVCEYRFLGEKVFEQSKHDFMESVSLYRKTLAKQPDKSVVIISVGFSTNLAKLLDSSADEYSGLTGKELVAQKVKLLCTMAGNFSTNPRKLEYNIKVDIPAAQKVFSEWPTPIVTSPFGVGNSIVFPGSCIEEDLQWAKFHPMALGYIDYIPMPYDRQTWDLTAVLYAVEKDQNYFSLSEKGTIKVDDEGYTTFEKQANGNHLILGVDDQQRERIAARFIELVTKEPKNKSKVK